MRRPRIRLLRIVFCAGPCVVAGACATRPLGLPVPTRPEAPPVATVWMPESNAAVLPNGLKVVAVRDLRGPLFEARLVVKSGWRAEEPGRPGASLLVRELVRNGTAGLSSGEAARVLETEGVSFVAGSSADAEGSSTTFRMTGPSPGLRQAMGILSALVRAPELGESRVESRRRALVDSRSAQTGDVAAFAAGRAVRLLRLPDQRNHADPSAADLQQLGVEDARRFHAANYVPLNALLVIIGPQSIEELEAIASEAFGPWTDPRASEHRTAAAVPGTLLQSGGGCELIERPGSAQVTLALAAVVGGQAGADYPGLVLLRWLLLNRISDELVLRRNWTYYVGVDYEPGPTTGVMVIYTSVQPGRGGESLSVIRAELERLIGSPPDSAEMAIVKRVVAGELAIGSAERSEILASRVAAVELGGLGRDFWPHLREALIAVKGDHLQELTRRYFRPDAQSLIALGDPKELKGMACPSGAR